MNFNVNPYIFRKRLIIEGIYSISIKDEKFIADFLVDLARKLKMKIISGPFISSADGKSAPIHDGFEGQVVWAESGASLYVWSRSNFFTLDIYTCKEFNTNVAVEYVNDYFGVSEFSYYEIPDPLVFIYDRKIEVLNSELREKGVYAQEAIAKGEIISYVDGPVMYAPIESKIDHNARNHAIPFHRYFYRNGFNSNAVTFNHSCEPNCYIKDLFFVTAMRDIQKGEELTYSYSLFLNSDWKNPAGKCLCDSPQCLGDILPWRELPREYKLKYLEYTADWILLEEIKQARLLDKLEDYIH